MSDDRLPQVDIPRTPGRRWTLRSTMAAASLLVVAICTAIGITGTRLADAFDRVADTRAVIAAADGLLAALTDAETGQRGFLLTGDETYLGPYYSARPLIEARIADLDRLTGDSAAQYDILEELSPLVEHKLAELEETIIIRRIGGLPAAIDIVRAGHGIQTMDGIRGGLNRLLAAEQQQLDNHTDDVFTNFRIAMILGGSAAIGLVVLTFAYIRIQDRAHRQQIALTRVLETAKVELERRVEERTEELAQANLIMSRFLANVSHELRTPLNAIIGYADAISSRMLGPLGNDRYAEFAGNIIFSGRHLLDMINQILDFSKVEAGGLELELEALDPVELAEGCIDMLRPMADQNQVELILDPGDAPRRIVADPVRLRQILVNLLSNAVKFTPEGRTVRLELAAVPVDAATPWLIRIRVCDQGIGMTPDQIQVALTPFGQVDNSMARRHAGTGLGLPLARHMIELHNGRFAIESEPGVGTTVEIAL
ncbi:CHASE3 domain-containing protein (plasmid) [Tistrella mobilis]|uniref:sensor histidine kinase n=1 Tax=Tistrella mobilis TaxID=171437 RepID=UPI003557DE09